MYITAWIVPLHPDLAWRAKVSLEAAKEQSKQEPKDRDMHLVLRAPDRQDEVV